MICCQHSVWGEDAKVYIGLRCWLVFLVELKIAVSVRSVASKNEIYILEMLPTT